jgi:hypothetical protein
MFTRNRGWRVDERAPPSALWRFILHCLIRSERSRPRPKGRGGGEGQGHTFFSRSLGIGVFSVGVVSRQLDAFRRRADSGRCGYQNLHRCERGRERWMQSNYGIVTGREWVEIEGFGCPGSPLCLQLLPLRSTTTTSSRVYLCW